MGSLAEKDSFYTYNEYADWPEEERYELIYGIPYMMSAPAAWHQRVLGTLYSQLLDFLEDKKCEPFMAPFDVRLFPREDGFDNTVVQPDIMVVCDSAKLSDGRACRGAPDFIIEILSDSTRKIDFRVKKELYLTAGVKEYWIVDGSAVYQYVLTGNKYRETIHLIKDAGIRVKSELFGFFLTVKAGFGV
jgi:Uma2 family endonuclease